MGMSGENYKKEGDIHGHVKKDNLEVMITITKQMENSVSKVYGNELSGT